MCAASVVAKQWFGLQNSAGKDLIIDIDSGEKAMWAFRISLGVPIVKITLLCTENDEPV